MAKNNKPEQQTVLDIKTARRKIYFEGELERKKKRAENKHCPYHVVRVWDAEKQKYVKTKVYRKKTTFTKAEMKERFKPCGKNIIKVPRVNATDIAKAVNKPIVHGKNIQMQPKLTHHYLGLAMRQRLDWDQQTLRYKVAALY